MSWSSDYHIVTVVDQFLKIRLGKKPALRAYCSDESLLEPELKIDVIFNLFGVKRHSKISVSLLEIDGFPILPLASRG